MPVADPAFGWQEAVAAFAIITVAAFLVTWILTDLLRIPGAPYIRCCSRRARARCRVPCLVGHIGERPDLVRSGVGAGRRPARGSHRAPACPPAPRAPARQRHQARRADAGEGLVYGIAEAVLLSTLPVLAVWQALVDLGRTGGGWAKVGSGTLAILGALLVILVHHLGYAELRTHAGRPGLFGALAICGVQAIAFVVTGSILAPIVAHIVLHGQLLLRGDELPPSSVSPRTRTRSTTIPPLPMEEQSQSPQPNRAKLA